MWKARYESQLTTGTRLLRLARHIYPEHDAPHRVRDPEFEDVRRALLVYFECAASREKRSKHFRRFLDERVRESHRRTVLMLAYLDIALAGSEVPGSRKTRAADSQLYAMGKKWWEIRPVGAS